MEVATERNSGWLQTPGHVTGWYTVVPHMYSYLECTDTSHITKMSITTSVSQN